MACKELLLMIHCSMIRQLRIAGLLCRAAAPDAGSSISLLPSLGTVGNLSLTGVIMKQEVQSCAVSVPPPVSPYL